MQQRNKILPKFIIVFIITIIAGQILFVQSPHFYLYGIGDALATTQTTQQDPGPRSGHRMTYIQELNLIYLFGGKLANNDRTPLSGLWEYNISTGTWTNNSYPTSPQARFNHCMVYIPNEHILFLFGGFDAQTHTELRDTWIFNISSDIWTRISTPSAPEVGVDCSITYSLTSHSVYLFGNFGRAFTYFWQFSLANHTWTAVNSNQTPSNRYGHSLHYHPISDSIYLFGGRLFNIVNDLFQYNITSTNWTRISTDNTPPARYWHSSVYMEDQDALFVFGGEHSTSGNQMLNDTWIFDFQSQQWTEHNVSNRPNNRILGGIAYSNVSSCIYLYGGSDSYSDSLSDFWMYNITTHIWMELTLESSDNNIVNIAGYRNIGLISSVIVVYFIVNKRNEKKRRK
jgi:N-acetylneuraminic acid mutarotase